MKFSVENILSITTHRLLCKNGMDGIVEITSFLSGEPVGATQTIFAVPICEKFLKDKYPELVKAGDKQSLNTLDCLVSGAELLNRNVFEAIQDWIDIVCEEYGIQKEYELSPIGEMK